MKFREEDYRKVEAVTLSGNSFNLRQREFIELMESKYIIAGPGVGKTTSLSAKIVLLLLNSLRKNYSEGMCVITKTNVAVDEINRILKQVGQTQLKHPHYIGTIHQFFNTYLAIPYIKKLLNPKNIRFGKETDFLPILKGIISRDPYFSKWSAKDFLATTICGSKLIFDSGNNIFDIENTTGWDKFERHKNKLFNIKWKLKEMGCYSFDEIFLFSTAAMQESKILSLLKKRFKYVFVDEFQDTNKSWIDLIAQIFNVEGNVLQFIGDPNQTIDFDGMMPTVPSNVFELNICNRFDNRIGRHLSYIVNNVNIQCLERDTSFNPILLVYENKKNLIKNYKTILDEEYLCNLDFAKETRKDSILGIQNNTINPFLDNYSTEMVASRGKTRLTESITRQMINLIHDALVSKIPAARENNLKLTDWLKEKPIYIEIKILLIESIKLKKLNVDRLLNLLNSIINEQDGQMLTVSNNVFSHITSLCKNADILLDESKEHRANFVFSTIHSAKGETHRSVLLIDSENDKKPKMHTKMLKAFYCGYELDTSENWVERNLLYVAMSRPIYLFTFAMDKYCITDSEINKFRLSGWEIKIID